MVGWRQRTDALASIAERLEALLQERDEAIRAALDESVALVTVQRLTGLTLEEVRAVQWAETTKAPSR